MIHSTDSILDLNVRKMLYHYVSDSLLSLNSVNSLDPVTSTLYLCDRLLTWSNSRLGSNFDGGFMDSLDDSFNNVSFRTFTLPQASLDWARNDTHLVLTIWQPVLESCDHRSSINFRANNLALYFHLKSWYFTKNWNRKGSAVRGERPEHRDMEKRVRG